MYTVNVDDYFHTPLISPEDVAEHRQTAGTFESYDDALAYAQGIVESVYRGALIAAEGDDQMMGVYWANHGEDAWISPALDGRERFSASDYFTQLCETPEHRASVLVLTRIPGMRKGTTDKPAYTHSFHVRDLLEEHGYGFDVCLAGLLHDIVEDGGVSLAELRAAGFSERVVGLVDLCSHDASIEGNDARWVVMIARLVQADDSDAWAIKVADLLDNLRDSGTMEVEWREWMMGVKRALMGRVARGVEEFLVKSLSKLPN